MRIFSLPSLLIALLLALGLALTGVAAILT